MEKTKEMPFWVFWAFSSIETRKMAKILIWSSVVFTLYSIPFTQYTNNTLIKTLFLIHDWSWAAIMVPICLWYWLSLRWLDKHSAWSHAENQTPGD